MKSLLTRMTRSPRLGRVLLAVSLPVFVTIGFAPIWAVGLSLATILLAAIFVYAEVLSPKFIQNSQVQANHTGIRAIPHLSAGDSTLGSNFTKSSTPDALPSGKTLMDQTLLKNWVGYGSDAVKAISGAQSEIREALRMSTNSALEIGHSIQKMQANHEAQSRIAKSLLEQTENGKQQDPSLADLAAAAAYTLKRQTEQIASTADNASTMLERQQMTNLIALRADDLLADADKAAKQMGLDALTSSDRDINSRGNSLPIDPLTFAQTYRNTIRELRSGLDAIRQSLGQVTHDLQNNVNSLKKVATVGRSEVDVITSGIQQKLDETRQTMSALNSIASDTEEHIRSAVVAMQYHDITSQKLSAIDSNRLQHILAHTQTMLATTLKQNPELNPAKGLEEPAANVAEKHPSKASQNQPEMAVDIFE